jgi:hypothetical protein
MVRDGFVEVESGNLEASQSTANGDPTFESFLLNKK